MHFLKMAGTYLRIGIANELQYRVNFAIQVLQSIIALIVGLIGINLVFSQTTELAGWTRPELLVVMGVYLVMGGIIRAAIQPNMGRLMEEIQDGSLDFALTKPTDAQALISVREFRFWQLVDVVLGLGVVVFAMTEIHSRMSIWDGFAFGLALVLGTIMIYCFWLILTSIAFWVIRVDQMVNLFEGVFAAGRWPVSIYPNWLRLSLTFLVPVAFAVTVPAEALTGRLTGLTLLSAAGLALFLLLLARFIWRKGIRNYSGASA